jgi:hypothetical protein
VAYGHLRNFAILPLWPYANSRGAVLPDIISLKMLGVAGVLSYATARLAAKAGVIGYRRFLLVSVPLEGMPDMPRGFTVRELTPDELSGHVIDASLSVQAGRFAQGLTCLGAFNAKNMLVGVTWVGPGPYTETLIHVRFGVPMDAAWDCGLWIAPRYRLGRGFAALWAGTAQWLRRHDRQSSVSWIADYNRSSLMSHRRMRSETIGNLTAIRFFRWQYVANGTPRVVRIDSIRPAKLDLSLP